MNKRTTILAAATFAAATITASAANNCAVVADPTNYSNGAALHTTWYGQCLTNSFSFGMWVKGMKSQYSCYSFYSQNVRLWCYSGTDDLSFRVVQSKPSDGTTQVVIATLPNWRSTLGGTDWHFYCCTFNYDPNDSSKSFQRLYVDGELKAQRSGSEIVGPAVAPVSGNHVTIGGNWDTRGWADNVQYAGSVSEVTVWSRGLSPIEVETLATRRASGFESGLEVYWPLAGDSVEEPNRARGGATATLAVHRDKYGTIAMAADSDFPLGNARCVASAEWIAEQGYVQPSDATFRSWDDPATNIATAFAAALPGETILLMPGTHPISEQIDITKANITFAHGPGDGEAVIDAQHLCRHFRNHPDHSGQSGFVFENLTFANGEPDGNGGSMQLVSNAGAIRNCTFRDNTANKGGAIQAYLVNGLVISNCVFAGNSATSYGGAIYTQQSSDNRDDKCIVVDCIITNNSAKYGGGINAERCIAISGCSFAGNRANTEGATYGGNARIGIYSTISNCTFTGACQAKYGSCIDIVGTVATVADCDFSGLAPSGFDGNHYGVIHINDVGNCTFADCVATNSSGDSTGMFFPENSNASLLVRQSILGNASNQALVADHGGKTRFENCTILSQSFDYKSSTSGQNVLVNCIVPNADITTSGNFVNIITNSLVKSVSGGTQDSGVMTGNPKFVDAAGGNYRLAATSSCREKGLVLGWMSGATDLGGNPRLVNILGRAAADALPDLGCYECQEVGVQPTVVTFK